ncbi:hypothetical protein [Nostoc sp.]
MMKLRHKKTFHPVPSPQSLAIRWESLAIAKLVNSNADIGETL